MTTLAKDTITLNTLVDNKTIVVYKKLFVNRHCPYINDKFNDGKNIIDVPCDIKTIKIIEWYMNFINKHTRGHGIYIHIEPIRFDENTSMYKQLRKRIAMAEHFNVIHDDTFDTVAMNLAIFLEMLIKDVEYFMCLIGYLYNLRMYLERFNVYHSNLLSFLTLKLVHSLNCLDVHCYTYSDIDQLLMQQRRIGVEIEIKQYMRQYNQLYDIKTLYPEYDWEHLSTDFLELLKCVNHTRKVEMIMLAINMKNTCDKMFNTQIGLNDALIKNNLVNILKYSDCVNLTEILLKRYIKNVI
jgi:hypothetical protein